MNYHKIYENLISNARQRLYHNIEGEWHHSIPRCLNGTDEKCTTLNSTANVVKLTYREHLFAHRLLCRIYPLKLGLTIAVSRMIIKYNKSGKELYTLYEADRRKISKAMSKLHKGKIISEEHREKSRLFHINRKQPPRTEAWNRNNGLAHKGIPCPDHVKAAVAKAATGRVKSKEEIIKISNSNKGKIRSAKTRELQSLARRNTLWINKDGITKRIKTELLNQYLTNGYSLGRINQPELNSSNSF